MNRVNGRVLTQAEHSPPVGKPAIEAQPTSEHGNW